MNKMESMDIRKLVLTMSVPIAASMLVGALYNIVDGIFVAQYSGQGFLAVSLAAPIQTLMIAVACGLGVGFNTVLARFLGQKKERQAGQAAAIGLWMALAASLFFAVVGWFGSAWFLSLFTDNAQVLSMGTSYLKISTLFSYPIFFQIAFERIMQAVGKPMYNLAIQGTGAVVNIILDPLFIFGLDLGVQGAAIATIIGETTAMTLGMVITKWKVKEFTLHKEDFVPDWSMAAMIWHIALPAIIMQALTSIMTVLMNGLLASHSEVAVSAFGAFYKLQQFVLMTVLGITNAIIPIIAFNFGAGHWNRIQETVKFSTRLAMVIMALGTLLFTFIPGPLLQLFGADQALMKTGTSCLQIISLSFIFMGISLIDCAAFQALNHSRTSLVITLFRQLFGLIPAAALLLRFFGINGCWAAFPTVEILAAAASQWQWHRLKTTESTKMKKEAAAS